MPFFNIRGGRSSIPKERVFGFALLAAIATLLVGAGTAQAHTMTGDASYGRINPIPQVYLNASTGYTSHFSVAPFNIGRSPAYSGTQYVTVNYKYYINYSNGLGWKLLNNLQAHMYIPPGGYGSVGWEANDVASGRYYHELEVVTWYTSGGYYLGQTTYDNNSPSDYTTTGIVWSQYSNGWLGLDPP
jgi:hypothetical protein